MNVAILYLVVLVLKACSGLEFDQFSASFCECKVINKNGSFQAFKIVSLYVL